MAERAAGSSAELPEGVVFANRREAGRRLARKLEFLGGTDAVVVGLARGGAVVAAEIARALGLPLDVLAVRKVGHPWQPEYGIGAVTPDGGVYLRRRDGLTEDEVTAAIAEARAAAVSLDGLLHARRPPLELAGRTCALVDDGLATGVTMIAAARWARGRRAARVVVAVPIAARESLRELEPEADALVCLGAPSDFGAVGFWYRRFDQVSDRAVVALLDEPVDSWSPRTPSA